MVLQFLFELLKSKYMFSCLQLRNENIKETLTQYIYLNTKEPYHKPHTIPKIYGQSHAIDHIISLEMLILSEDSRDLDTNFFTLVKYVRPHYARNQNYDSQLYLSLLAVQYTYYYTFFAFV